MKLLRSEKGISILETMIAVGLMGLAGYFLVGMLKNGFTGQKNLQSQDDARILTENIAQLLSDPTACENTFGGISGSGNPLINPAVTGGKNVDNILDFNMKVQFAKDGIYGNRTLKLAGMVIGGTGIDKKTNMPLWAPGPPPPAPPTGMAFVQVLWQQTGSAANLSGPQTLLRNFMVFATTLDSSGNIKKCVAQSTGGSGSVWSMNASNDIYNNNNNGLGKVGIGISTPTGALDVYTSMGHSLFVDSTNGNVGVNTNTPLAALDVSGTFRASPQQPGQPCSPLGAQAYHASSGHPLYCDGSKWKQVGGGPGGGATIATCNNGGGIIVTVNSAPACCTITVGTGTYGWACDLM